MARKSDREVKSRTLSNDSESASEREWTWNKQVLKSFSEFRCVCFRFLCEYLRDRTAKTKLFRAKTKEKWKKRFNLECHMHREALNVRLLPHSCVHQMWRRWRMNVVDDDDERWRYTRHSKPLIPNTQSRDRISQIRVHACDIITMWMKMSINSEEQSHSLIRVCDSL